MRIKPLSSSVANQIAAGEVIENPASVVKELLENALDANASVISIEIGFGGLNQIKISDNGRGILAEDLPLAIAPHATSKLTRLEDLSTLTSMGFRGEALASIASISHLTLSSKPAHQESAMMLQTSEDGIELSVCARNQGTTVDVRDLFFNAPVRRRFLRSERSEYLAIEHVVKRFALSSPTISLSLKHNGKLMLELPSASCEQTQRRRIQKILGKAFVDGAYFLDVESGGMHLRGWISGEHYQRSQNDKQWFYLNQRMVRDKLILHALKQAYDNRLHPGRHPSCLLYFTIPTTQVDVNVHPTKHEVRFQQPRLIHDFIGKSISNALLHEMIPSLDSDGSASFHSEDHSLNKLDVAPRASMLDQNHVVPSLKSLVLQSIPWLILNAQFGLITWKQRSYVVDLERVQQERAMYFIHQHPKPLASRPLLVPIREDVQEERLHDRVNSLLPYGIQLEMNKTQLVIRTIPVAMPQLDVKQLLRCLIGLSWEESDLPKILASCQPNDAFQLSADEKDQLGDYIVQQLERDFESIPWCILLDRERCVRLFDD